MAKKINKWIIFFGEDWGRHNSTGQYLAVELAQHANILWVNSLGLRTPTFKLKDVARIVKKLWEFGIMFIGPKNNQVQPENIKIIPITLLAVPLYKYGIIRWFNKHLVKRCLLIAMRRLGIENPIIVSACPATADVIGEIKAQLRIYYCADEYSAFPGLNPELVKSLENKLLGKVDVVFATSKNLEEAKKIYNQNTWYLPHGVNYKKFSSAINISNKPSDIESLAAPLVGFVGQIGEHIDLEKIQHLSENLTEGNIVMVGPLEDGVELPKGKNIHYIGPKSYKDLPKYQAHFNVCIVPYKQSERVKNANPTKIREYLAAGCPVVSIYQPEVALIDAPIVMADSTHEFTQCVLNILKGNVLDRQQISLTMQNQDWSDRAQEFLQVVYGQNT